jgi:hypothetical protein
MALGVAACASGQPASVDDRRYFVAYGALGFGDRRHANGASLASRRSNSVPKAFQDPWSQQQQRSEVPSQTLRAERFDSPSSATQRAFGRCREFSTSQRRGSRHRSLGDGGDGASVELTRVVSAGYSMECILHLERLCPSKAPCRGVRPVREAPSTSRESHTRDTLRRPSAARAQYQRAVVRASVPSYRVSAAQVPL